MRVFGYGSLIWRPDMPFTHRAPGWTRGWSRRFYQGSWDHRGTREAPGRVVTLLPDPEATTWGMVYEIDEAVAREVGARLDYREKGGYERVTLEVVLPGEGRVVEATTYIASPENPDYLGPAPLDVIARHIYRSRGPSGANIEYALELAEALRGMGADDPHVFEIERALIALQANARGGK